MTRAESPVRLLGQAGFAPIFLRQIYVTISKNTLSLFKMLLPVILKYF
ncbi:hypothetical protein [Leptospira noguchii]|nr:hypothetical protein [Leptospira noguchii]UOG53779.1 hypothetical protein MAL09_06560 [Leptospira noguchii]